MSLIMIISHYSRLIFALLQELTYKSMLVFTWVLPAPVVLSICCIHAEPEMDDEQKGHCTRNR